MISILLFWGCVIARNSQKRHPKFGNFEYKYFVQKINENSIPAQFYKGYCTIKRIEKAAVQICGFLYYRFVNVGNNSRK